MDQYCHCEGKDWSQGLAQEVADCEKGLDCQWESEDSDKSKEEVTPQKKKNAGQQFGHKGCHHKDWLLKPAYNSSSNDREVLYENNLSLIEHKAGPTDIRYVKGLHIQDIHHTGSTNISIDPNPLQCNLDSHANICCGGANCLLHQKSTQFQVSPARHYIHLYLCINFTSFWIYLHFYLCISQKSHDI